MKTFFNTKTYLEVNDPELFTKLSTHLENIRQTENHTVSGEIYEISSDDIDENDF